MAKIIKESMQKSGIQDLPLELVDMICDHMSIDILRKNSIFPDINRKRIEYYWTHRCPCCIVENNDLQGIKYNISKSNYNPVVIMDLFEKACKCGHLEMVKYFMSLKIVTCPIKNIGMLHAAKNNELVMLKYLVDQGAQISFNDGKALVSACENGNLAMVKYLVSLNADIIGSDNKPAIAACKKGNSKIVKYLVGIDTEKGNEILDDSRLVEWTAWSGNIRLVKYLVDQEVNITYRVLNKACKNGQLNMVKYLITEHLDTKENTRVRNIKNIRDRKEVLIAPMISACSSGNLKLVGYLETLGGDINTRENIGFYKAIIHGHLNIVKYYVNKGININGNRALINACSNGRLNIVKYLVSLGVKIDNVAVVVGCDSGHLKLSKYLINIYENHDPNFYNKILTNACHNGFEELVKFIVEKGANVQADNNKPIMYASLHENLNIMKYLVSKGSNPFDGDNEILMSACRQGQLNVIQYLVSLGADIHAQNDMAIQLACDHNNQEVEDYLLSLGAKFPDNYVYVDRTISDIESEDNSDEDSESE